MCQCANEGDSERVWALHFAHALTSTATYRAYILVITIIIHRSLVRQCGGSFYAALSVCAQCDTAIGTIYDIQHILQFATHTANI